MRRCSIFPPLLLQSKDFPHSSFVKSPKGPVLHLPNVQKSDAGTYICTASNGVGSMSADQIELEVLCEFIVAGNCIIDSSSTLFFQIRPR
jgi:hypothetical protein